MNLNFITNPKTNRKVSVHGKIGKSIIKEYFQYLNGGSYLSSPPKKIYEYDRKKILLFGGCFCPPHSGHFNIVKKNINNYDLILICAFKKGGEHKGRNKFTAEKNKEIFSKYVKELDLNKIKFISQKDSQAPYYYLIDFIKSKIRDLKSTQVDVVVGSDYKETSKKVLETIKNKLNKFNENSKLKIVERASESESSTKFFKAIENKNKEEMKKFIPIKENDELNKIITYILNIQHKKRRRRNDSKRQRTKSLFGTTKKLF